ncbi:MAG: class I SAM-dependent methyltransferase [Gammaproteobacteria bacterium]|nr:MAG: class I SAM-dependent methyltransferase [Gammaproteobacteria bacterium]
MSAAPGEVQARAAATQYDAIATQYQRSRRSPIRRFVEEPSLFNMLGDVADLAVLDLACGEGWYSRQLRRRGARQVVGADISAAMIDLARAQERSEPLGIDYRVCDARALPVLGAFDVVCAAYLLHYARDTDELARMCRSIAGQTVPGGRLVSLNENPFQSPERYAGYLGYGFSKSVVGARREGSPIAYAMVSGRELFRFEVYHFEPTTYERALAEAGFVDVRWHTLVFDPAGEAGLGADYWAEYLGNPPVIGLSCRRSGGTVAGR